jgi:peptidoglycan hydrolase-like protein with peptidoglycan-binding domain
MRLPLIKQWMACVLAAGLVASWAGNLRADEVLRHIQQSLRDQGFYYGPIEGSPGDETTQAIKRYQIRNGLPISGQLNDETRKSIEHAEAAVAKGSSTSHTTTTRSHASTAAASSSDNEDRQYAEATPPPLTGHAAFPPAQAAPPTVRSAPPVETDSGDENDSPAAQAPPPRPPDAAAPPSGNAVPPGAVAPSSTLTAMFARTPYEFAPPPVQADVLRHAQAKLLRDGFYDGPADGVPGPRIAEALSNLQQVSHVRATARLDMQTLAILRLLPRTPPGPPRYYYGPGPYQGAGPFAGPGGVYQGRIVQ